MSRSRPPDSWNIPQEVGERYLLPAYRDMAKRLSRLSPPCVIELYGTTGLFTLELAKVFPAARFHLHEPEPKLRELALANITRFGLQDRIRTQEVCEPDLSALPVGSLVVGCNALLRSASPVELLRRLADQSGQQFLIYLTELRKAWWTPFLGGDLAPLRAAMSSSLTLSQVEGYVKMSGLTGVRVNPGAFWVGIVSERLLGGRRHVDTTVV